MGQRGHGWACGNVFETHGRATATRDPLPYMHDVVEAEHGNDKELNSRIRGTSDSSIPKITKNSRSRIFNFPELGPERSWSIAGIDGVWKRVLNTRPRASRPPPQLHDVVAAEHGNDKGI